MAARSGAAGGGGGDGPAVMKLLLVGPKKTGKSTIADFVSEHTESLTAKETYQPTKALRILEFERDLGSDGRRSRGSVSVQLWDVSGDHEFESCWPAIMNNAVGVVLVYNPDDRAQEEELALWYNWFVKGNNLPANRAVIFAHRMAAGDKPRLSGGLAEVNVQSTSFESPGVLRMQFDKFLASISG